MFINDSNHVDRCELTIDTDVLINIATALQSDACTSYQLNVVDGQIANQDQLSKKQRRTLLEIKLNELYLGKKIPLDVTIKKTGEVLIPAHAKWTKGMIRKILRHSDALYIDPSPVANRLFEVIHEIMA